MRSVWDQYCSSSTNASSSSSPYAARAACGSKPGRAVLEGQTHLDQLGLDLVDRLGAEVADVEQVLLRARDELTHGVDALALEAVVGADGELQVLDREGQVGGQLLVDGRRADVDALGLDVELAGQAEQLDQRLAGRGDRVAGTDRRLGLDVDDELVEVGALLDTGGLDLVGHLEDRAVDRVDRHPADLVVARPCSGPRRRSRGRARRPAPSPACPCRTAWRSSGRGCAPRHRPAARCRRR